MWTRFKARPTTEKVSKRSRSFDCFVAIVQDFKIHQRVAALRTEQVQLSQLVALEVDHLTVAMTDLCSNSTGSQAFHLHLVTAYCNTESKKKRKESEN